MKHTIETARDRAIKLGYDGEYIDLFAADWIGKTDEEIQDQSDDFNRNYLRRAKYARAAAMETNPDRRAYLQSECL